MRSLAIAILLLVAAAGASAQSPVSVPEDLFAVISLQGKPCGKVVSHEKRGENDYWVRCESGHRYRVYVNEQNRVVVEER